MTQILSQAGVAVAFLAAVRLLLLAGDRGTRERWRFALSRRRRTDYFKSIVDAEQRGLRVHLLYRETQFLRRVSRRHALRSVVVLPALVVLFVYFVEPSPVVLAAALAGLTALGNLLGYAQLKLMGPKVPIMVARPDRNLVTLLATTAIEFAAYWGLWVGAGLLLDARPWHGLALMAIAVLAATAAGGLTEIAERRGLSRQVRQAAPDRSDFLYLRSFSDDSFRVYATGGRGTLLGFAYTKFEEIISLTIAQKHALHAIGRPGERLPELGAVRSYWPDDQWQGAVVRAAATAQGIVLVAASTEGLAWEIGHLREAGHLGKTLIIFPPDAPAKTTARFLAIAQQLGIDVRRNNRLADWSIVGLSPSDDGAPVLHVAPGRDWPAYLSVIHYFERTRDPFLHDANVRR